MIGHAEIERLRRRQRAFGRGIVYLACAATICALLAIVCWGPAGDTNAAFSDIHAHLDAGDHFRALGIGYFEKPEALTLAHVLMNFGLLVAVLFVWLVSRGWFCFAGLCAGLFMVCGFAGHVDKRTIYFSVPYAGPPAELVTASDRFANPGTGVNLRSVARYVAAQRAYLNGDPHQVHYWLSQAPFDTLPFSAALPWRYMAMREYANARGYTFADDARLNRELAWSRPSVMRAASMASFGLSLSLVAAALGCFWATAHITGRLRRIAHFVIPLAGAPA